MDEPFPPAREQSFVQSQLHAFSIEDALRIFARRWWVIAVCCVVAGAAAAAYSITQRTQYTASAQLLFRNPGIDQKLLGTSFSAPDVDPVREAATNSALASLPVIARQTATALGHGLTAQSVSQKVSTTSVGQADLVSVKATDPSPRGAARLANAYSHQYVSYQQAADRDAINASYQLVESELAQAKLGGASSRALSQLASFATQLKELADIQTGNASVVQPAQVPSSPSLPRTKRNVLLGVLAGLVMGVGLAFFFERLDRRIRDPEQIEHAYGLPLVGIVPESSAYTENPITTPLPPIEAEAFRLLRARLRYFNVDREIRSLIITSGGPNDGKTTVAVNLAVAECETGARVLLIDADFRRPTVARRLGLVGAFGLADVLTGSASLDRAIHRLPLGVPASFTGASTNGASAGNGSHPARILHVLPAGTPAPNPSELTESQRMALTLRALTRMYDRVIIDSPPMTIVSDIMPLVRKVDGVVAVTWVGRETRDGAKRLREQLRRLGAPALGIVGNRVPRTSGHYGYGYGYGYHGSGYEQSESEARDAADGDAVRGEPVKT